MRANWPAATRSVWRPPTTPMRSSRCEPDCVVYAASGPERDAGAVPDYLRLLEAGINVVSTSSTSLVYPPAYYSPGWRDQTRGRGEGRKRVVLCVRHLPWFRHRINWRCCWPRSPRRSQRIKVTEVALNDHYPVADVMMDGMGFGRPLDFEPMLKTPGLHRNGLEGTDLPDRGGPRRRGRRGARDRLTGASTDRDIEVAFGTITAGTCGAVSTRAAGVVNGREAIVIEHIIRMARDVAPDWLASEFDATYRVDIEGDPDIHCAMKLGAAEGHGAGHAAMAATAMRVVNAIPYVVDAPAGLLSSLDMPNTSAPSRIRLIGPSGTRIASGV